MGKFENPWGFSDSEIEELELNFNEEGYTKPRGVNALNRFGVGESQSLEQWLNRRHWNE